MAALSTPPPPPPPPTATTLREDTPAGTVNVSAPAAVYVQELVAATPLPHGVAAPAGAAVMPSNPDIMTTGTSTAKRRRCLPKVHVLTGRSMGTLLPSGHSRRSPARC